MKLVIHEGDANQWPEYIRMKRSFSYNIDGKS